MSGIATGIVSASESMRFQGAERRSSSLTRKPRPFATKKRIRFLADFGVVSRTTYRQALAGLSWLSSSPSRHLLRDRRSRYLLRFSWSPKEKLPTPAHVARSASLRRRAPWADLQNDSRERSAHRL